MVCAQASDQLGGKGAARCQCSANGKLPANHKARCKAEQQMKQVGGVILEMAISAPFNSVAPLLVPANCSQSATLTFNHIMTRSMNTSLVCAEWTRKGTKQKYLRTLT